MTRYEPPITGLELRWHSGLAAAFRLSFEGRAEYTFRRLETAMNRVFGFDFQQGPWLHPIDPTESTFFQVALMFRMVQWDSVGDAAEIVLSKDRAMRWLDDVCTGSSWTGDGGIWAPEAFHQLARELRQADHDARLEASFGRLDVMIAKGADVPVSAELLAAAEQALRLKDTS